MAIYVCVNGEFVSISKAKRLSRKLANKAIAAGFDSVEELDQLLTMEDSAQDVIKCMALNNMMKKYSKSIISDVDKIVTDLYHEGKTAKITAERIGHISDEYCNVIESVISNNSASADVIEKMNNEAKAAKEEKHKEKQEKRAARKAARAEKKDSKDLTESCGSFAIDEEGKKVEAEIVESQVIDEQPVVDSVVENQEPVKHTVKSKLDDETTRIPTFRKAAPNPVLQQ